MQGWQALIGTAHLQPTSLELGTRISEAWLGKDGRTLACLEFFSNAPLSYSLPRLAFPWPTCIQAFSHPSVHPSIHHCHPVIVATFTSPQLSYCLEVRPRDL